MKIYIARHGETEWNLINKLQGWQNSDLTEKGVRDAKSLAKRLEKIEFSNIYSSPLGRALDTAKYIKGDRDIEIELLPGLKEMGFGLWEGVKNEKVIELYGEEYYNYWNRPEIFRGNESEGFQRLFQRVEETLKYIIENSGGENILIMSHGITIKAIYAIVKDHKLEDFWDYPYVDGASLSILEVNGDKMELILEGDTSHFEEYKIIEAREKHETTR